MAKRKTSQAATIDGTMAFSELSSTDPAATRNFLEKVFAWRFQSVKFPLGEYLSFEAPGGGRGGIRPVQAKEIPGSMNYVRVDDLAFVGPFESFHRPEPYLEALGKLHHIIERVEPKKTFVDGDDVCLLYDMVTNTPAGTAFICEWYRVRGDRIGSIRAVFDARPFAPMFNR